MLVYLSISSIAHKHINTEIRYYGLKPSYFDKYYWSQYNVVLLPNHFPINL